MQFNFWFFAFSLIITTLVAADPICYTPSNTCIKEFALQPNATLEAKWNNTCVNFQYFTYRNSGCEGFWRQAVEYFGANFKHLGGVSAALAIKADLYKFNAQLRKFNASDSLPDEFKIPIGLLSDGVAVMREDPVASRYLSHYVYRGEPEYPGSICNRIENFTKPLELLNEEEVIIGFSSTSTRARTAATFGSSSRLLVIKKLNISLHEGPGYIYPSTFLGEYEITYVPGTKLKLMACEQRNITTTSGWTATHYAVTYAYDITNHPVLSLPEEKKLIVELQQELTRNLKSYCFPFKCYSAPHADHTGNVVKKVCTNMSAGHDPNLPVKNSTCELDTSDKAFQIRAGNFTGGNCFTAVAAKLGSPVIVTDCDDSKRALQTWWISDWKIQLTNDTSNLCMSTTNPVVLEDCTALQPFWKVSDSYITERPSTLNSSYLSYQHDHPAVVKAENCTTGVRPDIVNWCSLYIADARIGSPPKQHLMANFVRKTPPYVMHETFKRKGLRGKALFQNGWIDPEWFAGQDS